VKVLRWQAGRCISTAAHVVTHRLPIGYREEHARPCERQHVALFNAMARMTPSTRKTVHVSIHVTPSSTHAHGAAVQWLRTAVVAGLAAAALVTVPAAGSPVSGTLHRRPLPLNVDVGLVVPTDGGAAVDWVRTCTTHLRWQAGAGRAASHPSNSEFQSPPTSCTILAITRVSPQHTLRPSLLAFRHSFQLPTVHLDFHHAHHAPHSTPSWSLAHCPPLRCTSIDDQDLVRKDISLILTSTPKLAPTVLRLAWHASGTYVLRKEPPTHL
jgi:hypothetical protein